MQYINSIEKKLIDSKLSTLNEGSVSNNFDSLVSTQRLNVKTETTIKSEVMKPTTRTLASPSNRGEILRPTTRTTKTGTNTNKPHGTSLLSLKPTPKTPLTFGATELNNGKNTKLLNTLKGTDFRKPQIKDEEFEDFQTASKSTINWDSEVQKKIDIPLYNTTLNSHTPKQTTSWQPMNFTNKQQPNSSNQSNVQTKQSAGLSFQPVTTTQTSNFPPGFNANMVLFPNTDTMPKPKPKPNNDLLDLI
jgi:SCY1-like protein 2